ncbi:MAG: 1-(5-phosphoribosyl)-5-[(5-phosphoribosylamino)methylideneamino] imidazole-4-carboxamide isomerase [Bacteroidales bacterium]|nr:1-(5-phosphoribosyl)-5-[(5-phosphoribosylamino)methylideneamino] imidazole-4-carboxamide isomerase [Bacteroidales bacterium]MCD8393657.1 1-(5-phosphoribosyl)-5-[(5-phosphoribosylamino)methylideneamino] imidazole-4-carboxamide isomerase [Bacteroidales bacterium]
MIEIIPAIDIISGKCVRLCQGDYDRATTYGDPVEMAQRLADAGCRRLHLVDLDGAKAAHVVNYRVIEGIAKATPLVIDFGGGVKTDEDLHIALSSGASMVTAGSIAVKSPATVEKWVAEHGPDVVILGADARDGRIATQGWLEESTVEIVPFIARWMDKGLRQVISTDISVDGTLAGPSLNLYKRILQEVPSIHLIASGGVGSMADVEALDTIGVPQVIAGKAIYEGRITMKQLEKHNLQC